MTEFDIIDLGLLHYIHSLQIIQNDCGIFISQDIYKYYFLMKFNMFYCKTHSISMSNNKKLCFDNRTAKVNEHYYKSLVGKLMYFQLI